MGFPKHINHGFPKHNHDPWDVIPACCNRPPAYQEEKNRRLPKLGVKSGDPQLMHRKGP